MKFFPLILCAAIACVFGGTPSIAQTTFVPFGLEGRNVRDVVIMRSGSVLALADTGFYRLEADAHSIWVRTRKYADPYGGTPENIIPISDSDVRSFAYDFMEVSSDTGTTWVHRSLGGKSLRTVVVVGDSVLIAGDGNGLLRSTDLGTTWKSLGTSNGLSSDFFDIGTIGLGSKGRAIAANQGITGGLAYTTADTGKHWSRVLSAGTDIGAVCMINPTTFLAAVGTSVKRTTNGGGSWSTVGSLDGWRCSAFLAMGDTVYAGTVGNGLWASFDRGISWIAWGGPILSKRTITRIISTADAHVIVGTDSGLFITAPEDAIVSATSNSRAFWCSVYPNPAHSQVRIVMHSPAPGPAQVKIVDTRGVVVTILHDIRSVSDDHIYEWNAEKIAAGTYYCVATCNGQMTTSTILLQ